MTTNYIQGKNIPRNPQPHLPPPPETIVIMAKVKKALAQFERGKNPLRYIRQKSTALEIAANMQELKDVYSKLKEFYYPHFE